MLVNSNHLDRPLIIKFWYEPNFLLKDKATGRTLGFRDTPPAEEDNGPEYEIYQTYRTGCVFKLGAEKDPRGNDVIVEAFAQQDSRDIFIKDNGRRQALKHAIRLFCEKNILDIADRKERGQVHNDIINDIMDVYKKEHRTPVLRKRPKSIAA